MTNTPQSTGISRRSFLKGLGALAVLALPACRRAQQYAVEPEACPEWMLPGEATCYATAMPWASGAIPLLAICHNGQPVALQANPQYAATRPGVPAFAQASILDLYDAARPSTPTRAGNPHPMQAIRNSLRAWGSLLKAGRNVAFLFPEGYSALRMAQVKELQQYPGAQCYAWDPAALPRPTGFAELEALQNAAFGSAVRFRTGFGTLAELTRALPQLDTLFIFTPADPAAFDADFAHALKHSRAETIRFCSHKPDTTAALCLYTIPQTHFLEEWGADADAAGNLCLRQPVTQPLRDALAEAEVLHALLRNGELPDTARKNVSTARAWLDTLMPDPQQALRHGILPHAAPAAENLPPLPAAPINYYLHPYYADGRFKHNLWLQETYLPLSGWAGAAEAFVPGQSTPCGISLRGRTLPAWQHPGLGSTWLPLQPEYLGARPQDIQQTAAPALPYSNTQTAPAANTTAPYTAPAQATGPQWAMLIDLSRCIGCGACTLACRAENNIPTVGAAEMCYGRDLQWLRIGRYLSPTGKLHYVPTACRHCEKAPCEAVCPVNATLHSSEGLNTMVYPRCWGTRYCAAACPYNARVFNFRDYAKQSRAQTHLPHNPQVTVRSRGVMEKCTYCVQRINAAADKKSGTPQTACQQACPTGAIRLVDLCSTTPPAHTITAYDVPGTRPRTLYL